MPTNPTDSKIFLAAIRQLPPLMKTILANPALVDNSIALGEQYHLEPWQETQLMAIERGVIIQRIPVVNIPNEIRKLGLGPDETTKLTLDFLGRIILPMEWHVGGVQMLIKQLGGRVEEYLYNGRQQFPEVYAPKTETPVVAGADSKKNHPLLQNFEDKVDTSRGRADLLLRLTGLAGQVDELMKTEKLSQADGEEVLRNLDTLSYAVNTQDLNPLEVQSLKRRLRKVLGRLAEMSA